MDGVFLKKSFLCNPIDDDYMYSCKLDKVGGYHIGVEFMNNPHTHRTANTRSFSTENAIRQSLLHQVSFIIMVQGYFPPSGWKVCRSTYLCAGLLKQFDA
jgi:hypothetical protein